MRKKFHKCINPHNKMYDKFYINNYLESGIIWKQGQVMKVVYNLKSKMFQVFKNIIFFNVYSQIQEKIWI